MIPSGVLSNVATDTPINQVRGTSFPFNAALVDGPQPVLPTDPIYPPTDLDPSGTYLLFMIKLFDADPDTNIPVPDEDALFTLDSRQGQIAVPAPASQGKVSFVVPPAATTVADVYGNMVMKNGVQLRWSLKLFLGDGMGGVASEQIPLSGTYTVYDRSVQVI